MTLHRQLHLVLDFGALASQWKWKEQGKAFTRLPSFQDFLDYAKKAEAAHFDAVFMADFIGLNRTNLAGRAPVPFEPQTILSALAVTTSRIGLIGTQSTLFNYPYNVARLFAALDHLSGGRSAWNLVTSFNGESNYGFTEIPTPEERYDAAQEFLDIINRLWDSWDKDVFINDPANPLYVDTSKVHDVIFSGQYHSINGALDLPRPVQGRPVLVQAGASDIGLDFAARNAEVVFVAALGLEHAQSLSQDLTVRLEAVGRSRDSIRILPGLRIVVAETEEEAVRLRATQYSSNGLEAIRAYVEREVEGLDLSGLDLDSPIPPERFPDDAQIATMRRRRSRAVVLRGLALAKGTTLRDFLQRMQGSGSHFEMIGTPLQIADQIEEWYGSGAVDGFILGAGIGHELFFERVVPELVKRGLFRSNYEHETLRGHLGLSDI